MKLRDLLAISFGTIRSNKLRSGITVTIIALGIAALIGIVTAIDVMSQKLTESFSNLGANGFTIRSKERNLRIGSQTETGVVRKAQKQAKRSHLNQPIILQEAEAFRDQFSYPANVALTCFGGNANQLVAGRKETNPNIAVTGIDENYLPLNGLEIAAGRNVAPQEVQSGANVCLLGYDVANTLFSSRDNAIGKAIESNSNQFRVIGVLKTRGTTLGFNRDNVLLICYKNVARNYQNNGFTIGIKAERLTRVEEAMGEAEASFRSVRKLSPTEQSNFSLERSDNIVQKATNSFRFLTIAVTMIGVVTLIGAAIGLMNIMLVAVAERTKEIGLLKSIGAKGSTIRLQFLIEAVFLSLLGALIGIIAGIALGNLVGLLLHTNFIVPWNWISYGVIICTIVGLSAGIYPAWKAGKLNPVEALRYE